MVPVASTTTSTRPLFMPAVRVVVSGKRVILALSTPRVRRDLVRGRSRDEPNLDVLGDEVVPTVDVVGVALGDDRGLTFP